MVNKFKKPPTENLTMDNEIELELSEEELELLESLAKDKGISVNDLIIEILKEELDKGD